MNKSENIVESVNFVSEEDLLVQELDKRISFDMLPVAQANRFDCDCLHKIITGCDCKVNFPHPSTCGVRG